jgi:hypothetical protein
MRKVNCSIPDVMEQFSDRYTDVKSHQGLLNYCYVFPRLTSTQLLGDLSEYVCDLLRFQVTNIFEYTV